MGDILWVNQIFFSGICLSASLLGFLSRPTLVVEFLKMVDFVFIFIVAVMTGSGLTHQFEVFGMC